MSITLGLYLKVEAELASGSTCFKNVRRWANSKKMHIISVEHMLIVNAGLFVWIRKTK